MNDTDYEIAVEFANTNFNKIEKSTPLAIKKREEAVFQKISTLKGNNLSRLNRLYSEMGISIRHLISSHLAKKVAITVAHRMSL